MGWCQEDSKTVSVHMCSNGGLRYVDTGNGQKGTAWKNFVKVNQKDLIITRYGE